MGIFLDSLILLILVLFVLRGVFKGFIKGLLNFAGMLASTFLASYLGKALAAGIYGSFIRQSIINTVANSVNSAVGENVFGVLDKILEQLPIIKTLIPQLGQSENIAGAIASGSSAAAEAVESLIAPVITSLMAVVLTSFIFIVLIVLVRLIVRKITKAAGALPGLNGFNRTLGGILGLLSGGVFVMLAVEIIKLALNLGIGEDIFGIEVINQTILFRAFYNYNIFEFIFSSLLSSASESLSTAAGAFIN